jgi:hypothetical protein
VAVTHEYDTPERDLERAGMALTRHSSEAGIDWRLTLPHGEQVEAWEPGTSGLVPPPEIARLIRSVTAGQDLVPSPPPRELPADYGRFEELTRRLFSAPPPRPRQAGSGAT